MGKPRPGIRLRDGRQRTRDRRVKRRTQRGLAARKHVVIFDQHRSIGFRSGEYGDR